jgi:hypothetical protein
LRGLEGQQLGLVVVVARRREQRPLPHCEDPRLRCRESAGLLGGFGEDRIRQLGITDK